MSRLWEEMPKAPRKVECAAGFGIREPQTLDLTGPYDGTTGFDFASPFD